MEEKTYVAIDLKSFYASVECVLRGLDPLDANLVVADVSRTEKTICLAVSPSLKAYNISGRARLFEVVQRVKEINAQRRYAIKGAPFRGKSYLDSELKKDPYLELDYLAATPQMAQYMDISSKIYNIYKKYVSEEDIIVYSIDEVFIDVTKYLKMYGTTAKELCMRMILDVLHTTGITATAGIGTNLYLCKIAMDIVAKHIPPDENGVRIAELNERSYRENLWSHTPLTDFWRVGPGTAKRLISHNMFTMGDVALMSTVNEDLLYKLFGVNAELLIDHAWGYEPTEIPDIRAYKPVNNCLSSGQVLHCPYTHEKAGLIVAEMADALSLDLVSKGLVTDQIVLGIGYDVINLTESTNLEKFDGEIKVDRYGRLKPKDARGTVNLGRFTSATSLIVDATTELYEKITDKKLFVRYVNITANHIIGENDVPEVKRDAVQLDLFTDFEEEEARKEQEEKDLQREHRRQKSVVAIQKKFGKNALLKGMNLEEGATMKDRNNQVGGHKA